jgi:DNA-binding transcriptional LysR family regulator
VPPHSLASMDKISLELRPLANFVVACQNTRMSETAASLGHTSSALSTSLHTLEERLGLSLFLRQGSHLGLRPAAFWLFRHGYQLLYLEQYARGAFSLPRETLFRIVVRLDLSLAIGRFSKALIRATQEMLHHSPETFVEWQFASSQDGTEEPLLTPAMEALFEAKTETLGIFYDDGGHDQPERMHLGDDPWILVGQSGADLDLSGDAGPVVVMKMRPRLMSAISAYGERQGLGGRLKFVDDDPTQLARLILEWPHLRFLMPASMLAGRMGLSRLEWRALTPALVSPLFARTQKGASGKSRLFLDILKNSLAREDQSPPFEPRLTTRQIHYFNLTSRSGGLSAAARVANVAQSSISAQIQKMETAMGVELLKRRSEGAGLSQAGANLLPFTMAIEERQAWLMRKSRDVAAHSQANVRIGTLPSSGHDSAMTERIARAITTVHASQPSWKLQISEGSNAVLHERVKAGLLNLAVVGAAQPQVARIPLGASEPLSVVANPQLRLPDQNEISLEDACKLPLVLGARQLSIHQNFADAAKARHLPLKPVIEVGSLALAIAIIRSAPLCTILPASSVQKDVEAGLLVTIPISRNEVPGALSIIFSADRSLSEAERTIVQTLVDVFGKC